MQLGSPDDIFIIGSFSCVCKTSSIHTIPMANEVGKITAGCSGWSGCFPPELSETAAWNPTYDRVRNDEVLQRTCLTSLSQSHLLSRRRISVSGHVARLDDTPANMALQLHINVSLNRPPDRTWRRPPGRPRNKWLDKLRNDPTSPTGDLWMRAVDRGHGGATTRRPSPATRQWWW